MIADLPLQFVFGRPVAYAQTNNCDVRHSGVTDAAKQFMAGGVINYTRGRIGIATNEGMDVVSWACDSILKTKFDPLAGTRPRARPTQVELPFR
jgi:hypothetical protein